MPVAKGKNYKQLNKAEKDTIVELYSSGKTYKEIIEIFPITIRSLPLIMKEYNINSRRRGGGYFLNENYFDEIDTERKAYWLGLIASDGCITETNYFAISLKDEEILQELKADLGFSGNVYSPKSKDGVYYRINFSSKTLCDALRRIGIHERKSLSYNSFPNIRHGLIRHFIRGYFDGDGTIYSAITTTYNPRRTSYTDNYAAKIIATRPFCEELLREIFDEIGYVGKINESRSNGMFYFSIYKNKALKDFYWYMYANADLYLERKHNKWLKFLGSLEEKSSIEKSGELLEG